jgi:hypothetical protein
MRLHLFEPKLFDTPPFLADGSLACICGYGFKHPIHIQNGGVVCDITNLICACSAWHGYDYEDQVNEAFKMKISVPGYVLNKFEAEIIRILVE